jgi:hypothetical protein
LAKSLVCKPAEFTQRFGTYYMTGKISGSYMRIFHSVEGVEDKESFSMDVSASGSGWGVSISSAYGKATEKQNSKMT